MCGINGIIRFDDVKIKQKDIFVMNQKIDYRGPDDEGLFIENNIALGHRRLSIIDLSKKGHQPFVYIHKGREVVLTYNGEIYNFQEVKAELLLKGYEFQSETDTEIIPAAYLEWGSKCVEKFNGMFAFVLFDKTENMLFGARDRFGQKPLKYYHDSDKFIFSSELKAILTQNIKKEVDYGAIDEFLTLQYVAAPKTGFKNIYKLPHAHYFKLDLDSNKITINRYWNLNYQEKLKLSKKEWVDKLDEALSQSVKKRLMADVPLGAFLSGGVDSSAIVAFMSKFRSEIKTFSIGFKEGDYDETEYARLVANQYKTDHKELIVEPSDMMDLIEKLIYQYEEPYADSSQLPTYILAELTKKDVKVVLNGDGGDENFGGYDKYAKHLLANYLFIPFNHLLAELFNYINKNLYSSLLIHKIYIFIKTFKQPNWLRHFTYTHYFDIFTKSEFYKKDFREKIEELAEENTFSQIIKRNKDISYMDRIFYIDFNSYMPDDLMVKVDMATMANSLEARSPLLDYKFVELAAKIPAKLKISFWGRKSIFKTMLQPYLGKEILYRKKKGFSIPIEYWFRNELKNYVRDIVLNEEGLVLKIMQKKKIESLLRKHNKGLNNSKKIWILMVLNLWYKEYFLKHQTNDNGLS